MLSESLPKLVKFVDLSDQALEVADEWEHLIIVSFIVSVVWVHSFLGDDTQLCQRTVRPLKTSTKKYLARWGLKTYGRPPVEFLF